MNTAFYIFQNRPIFWKQHCNNRKSDNYLILNLYAPATRTHRFVSSPGRTNSIFKY